MKKTKEYKHFHRYTLPRERGKASEFQCFDCDSEAKHWSWSWKTKPIQFDVVSYDPRCVPCHARYDGKNFSIRNTSGSKKCKPGCRCAKHVSRKHRPGCTCNVHSNSGNWR